LHHETDDESDAGEDHPDEPEAHDDRLFTPASSFEMMVKRSDAEYFFPISQFLGGELDDDGADLEDVDTGNDDEDDECVGHHGDDTEIGAEGEWADVAHVELGGFDIEPEKGDEGSDDEHTNCREDEEALIIGDEGINDVVEEEESAGESVESIGDIDRIGHGDDDEYKKRDIEESDLECPEERDTKTGMSEFDIEPVGSESGEYCQEDHFNPCRETFGSADPTHIEIVIHKSDESDTCECKESKISFISIPEAVFHTDTEDVLDIGCKKLDDYGNGDEWENREEDYTSAHYWSSGFVFVEFGEFGRLTHECLFANLFAELVSAKKSDIWGDEYESEEEWEEKIEEEKSKISHRVWLVKS